MTRIILDSNNNEIDLSVFSNLEIIAKTAWAECRGGGLEGMQSVINVIFNRSNDKRWSPEPRFVCLQKWQFSCWNDGLNPNRDKAIAVDNSDANYAIALDLAQQALDGTLSDITQGSVYYFVGSIATPSWAVDYTPCCVIKGQKFFNSIPN